MDAPERRRLLIEKAFSLTGALVYVVCAAAMIMDFRRSERPSDLFMVVLSALFAFFFAVRKPPQRRSNTSPRDWLVAAAGSFLQGLFRPLPGGHDLLAAQAVQGLGMLFTIVGVLTLSTSFGMVAVNRGLKTHGIYKYLRHPIYAGYLLTGSGFLVQNIDLANAAVYVGWLCFETKRILIEEDVLREDPAYADYMKKTRWRVLPGVF